MTHFWVAPQQLENTGRYHRNMAQCREPVGPNQYNFRLICSHSFSCRCRCLRPSYQPWDWDHHWLSWALRGGTSSTGMFSGKRKLRLLRVAGGRSASVSVLPAPGSRPHSQVKATFTLGWPRSQLTFLFCSILEWIPPKESNMLSRLPEGSDTFHSV